MTKRPARKAPTPKKTEGTKKAVQGKKRKAAAAEEEDDDGKEEKKDADVDEIEDVTEEQVDVEPASKPRGKGRPKASGGAKKRKTNASEDAEEE